MVASTCMACARWMDGKAGDSGNMLFGAQGIQRVHRFGAQAGNTLVMAHDGLGLFLIEQVDENHDSQVCRRQPPSTLGKGMAGCDTCL